MKKHQLILLTTVLFITLFYEESIGINLAILGIAYAVLIFIKTEKRLRTKIFLLLFAITLSSAVALGWFGDFISGIALIISLFLLAFRSKNGDLKFLLALPLFLTNFITFIGRFFEFRDWLPSKKTTGMTQKIISVFVIPFILIAVFFGVYSLGSDHFSTFFSTWEFDLNFWEFFWLTVLGFFLAFTLWNFKLYNFIINSNNKLNNDFANEEITQEPTYSFLDIDAERKSGVVSFLALNLLLLIFIVTFNYEQFFEVEKNPYQLSAETHERVNAVILSIVLAIAVIMFYFKGNFNFDIESKSLKILAKIWIILNAILVISAVAKNSEYILNFGLTYKRLGVYAFLILALIGLVLTFYKIQYRKKNAFLFNQMIWYFYGIILVCSFINWGAIATTYNIQNQKGNFEFLSTFEFNDRQLENKYPAAKKYHPENDAFLSGTFLSRILYYESLK